jgi:hypothetical protein
MDKEKRGFFTMYELNTNAFDESSSCYTQSPIHFDQQDEAFWEKVLSSSRSRAGKREAVGVVNQKLCYCHLEIDGYSEDRIQEFNMPQ